jgi:hypothetical protein
MLKPALSKRRGGRTPIDFTDEQWQHIARRVREGATNQEIYSEMGVGERTFYNILKRRKRSIMFTRFLVDEVTGVPVLVEEDSAEGAAPSPPEVVPVIA